ncbi:MAG: hypothetical protein WDM88_09805 [Galbitalea sp.]
MGRFLLRLLINTFALWVTTLIVPGVRIKAYADGFWSLLLTLLLVALVFGS